jgi:hypothetical protein
MCGERTPRASRAGPSSRMIAHNASRIIVLGCLTIACGEQDADVGVAAEVPRRPGNAADASTEIHSSDGSAGSVDAGAGPDRSDSGASKANSSAGLDAGGGQSVAPDSIEQEFAAGESKAVVARPVPLEPIPLEVPAYEPLEEERPDRPAWTRPEVPLGESGWRGSEEQFCVGFTGRNTDADLWADDRGLYVLRTVPCRDLEVEDCPYSGEVLEFNDGTGWSVQLISSNRPANDLIGAFSTGAAILGWSPAEIAFLEEGVASGVLSLAGPPVVNFQALGQDVVYVAGPRGDADASIRASELFIVTPTHVTPLGPVPGAISASWADEQRAVFAGWDEFVLVYSVSQQTLTILQGVPAGTYSAVWGFGDQELWLGNDAGQLLHIEDASQAGTWELIETGSREAVQQLWGADGTVFFRTEATFGRATTEGAELLVDASDSADPLRVRSLWGNSPTEVFVAFDDPNFERYACGSMFISWFDGSQFHLM